MIQFSEDYLLHLVAHSSRIENISITQDSANDLFINASASTLSGNLHNLFSIRNNQMVAGFLNAMLLVHAPLSVSLIKQTHKLLMQGSYDHKAYVVNGERPGTFRNHDYCVGRYDAGSSAEDVEFLIEDLCDMINGVSSDGYKKAAAFHCYFEAIHPFADGNGRCGRWLLNYILALSDIEPIIIPVSMREEYYAALEAYDRDEDFQPMLSVILASDKGA